MTAVLVGERTFPASYRGKCVHDGTWRAFGYDPVRDLPYRECEAGGCRQWGEWCRACGGVGEVPAAQDHFGNFDMTPCLVCHETGRRP